MSCVVVVPYCRIIAQNPATAEAKSSRPLQPVENAAADHGTYSCQWSDRRQSRVAYRDTAVAAHAADVAGAQDRRTYAAKVGADARGVARPAATACRRDQ